jgi:hypothetical protein
MTPEEYTEHFELAPVAQLSTWQRRKLSALETSRERLHLHGRDPSGAIHFATPARFTEAGSLVWPRYGTVSADGQLDWHLMPPTVA